MGTKSSCQMPSCLSWSEVGIYSNRLMLGISVCCWTSLTIALWMTAPLWSTTCPVMDPLDVCAFENKRVTESKTITKNFIVNLTSHNLFWVVFVELHRLQNKGRRKGMDKLKSA